MAIKQKNDLNNIIKPFFDLNFFFIIITIILFGIYWDKASSAGAIDALNGGLSALFGLEPIRKSIPIINRMNPEEIGLITLFITIIMMVVFSILLPDRKERISW